MYARAVDEASARLRDLHREEWEDLGLAALALGLALAATQIRPALALPFFFGGLVIGALGVRALWRRWDLLDRLAGERDAYAISEVVAFASREATMERRRLHAELIHSIVREPGFASGPHAVAAAQELEVLALELEDPELELDPACAVSCTRLLSDPGTSPLFDPSLPPQELRSRVRQIRSGFRPRERAA